MSWTVAENSSVLTWTLCSMQVHFNSPHFIHIDGTVWCNQWYMGENFNVRLLIMKLDITNTNIYSQNGPD